MQSRKKIRDHNKKDVKPKKKKVTRKPEGTDQGTEAKKGRSIDKGRHEKK